MRSELLEVQRCLQDGRREHSRANWSAALDAFLEAKELMKRFGALGPGIRTDVLAGIASSLRNLGDLQRARYFYVRALDVAGNGLGRNSVKFAVALCGLGILFRLEGRHLKAARCQLRALGVLLVQPRESQHLADGFHNLAIVCKNLGDLEGAKESFTLELEIMHRLTPRPEKDIESTRGCLTALELRMAMR